MYKRVLESQIKLLMRKYPIVTVLGPRQSGKTTLVRSTFPEMPYINLEDLEVRSLASADPKNFLAQFPNGAILDEIQRTPHLLSYLQVIVDEMGTNGIFVLTGSHQASLHSAVSQSLAGRTALLKLLPLSIEEMEMAKIEESTEEHILKGGYPRVYKEDLPVDIAYSSYFQTYVERDVRQILQIKDLIQFERFIKLIASRIGQLINYTSLSCEIGVSSNTIKEWVAILEATYILFRLEPFYENFGKRIIKTPKLYFVDTGLACYLLGIESVKQLCEEKIFGSLFENWVVVEMVKARLNQAKEPRFYFYRDVAGHEVDLVYQKGSDLVPIEIKSSQTFSSKFTKGLDDFHRTTNRATGGHVIYRGDMSQKINNYQLHSIKSASWIFKEPTKGATE
ncbi:MAG: hypothetical protein S4CHLAM81_15240 [Chlamydiales bacterium]|nr:hypothetical protein [Chlamydiales bacterium]MCH9636293.1 hypothetical protein [Chlamydiales bacterium]MCH9703193.1 ATP-binding protein [Chlamydiota bacterium]